MDEALNLLLLQGPECREISAQPTFLWWGGTTKSHMEASWNCREDGPEPGCFTPMERSQWPWLCGFYSALRTRRRERCNSAAWCQNCRRACSVAEAKLAASSTPRWHRAVDCKIAMLSVCSLIIVKLFKDGRWKSLCRQQTQRPQPPLLS